YPKRLRPATVPGAATPDGALDRTTRGEEIGAGAVTAGRAARLPRERRRDGARVAPSAAHGGVLMFKHALVLALGIVMVGCADESEPVGEPSGAEALTVSDPAVATLMKGGDYRFSLDDSAVAA